MLSVALEQPGRVRFVPPAFRKDGRIGLDLQEAFQGADGQVPLSERPVGLREVEEVRRRPRAEFPRLLEIRPRSRQAAAEEAGDLVVDASQGDIDGPAIEPVVDPDGRVELAEDVVAQGRAT